MVSSALYRYLNTEPFRDYVLDSRPDEEKIMIACNAIANADSILIGAGSGLSTAAGLSYSGKRFQDAIPGFTKKYGITDMYSSSFYPFKTEEEKWAYWARHVRVNRIDPPALDLYLQLRKIVGDRYFVITTNVDHQFWKAGFADNRIFAPQGDYGLIQCAHACHDRTYDAVKLFMQMDQAARDCRIPSYMVPHCPVYGGRMAMNLRCDQYFVEDQYWHEAASRYSSFIEENRKHRVVMLEIGVGFNTPSIIRFPFEHMLKENRNWMLIRCNPEYPFIPESLSSRAVGLQMDFNTVIEEIGKR